MHGGLKTTLIFLSELPTSPRKGPRLAFISLVHPCYLTPADSDAGSAVFISLYHRTQSSIASTALSQND